MLAALCALLLVGAAACLPQDRGKAKEVQDGEDIAPSAPPRFPETGPVPAALLVQGLLYDFTSAPTDLDLWVPPTKEARCAASKIVDGLGADRLSELGYRPATSGASLNDIDLSAAERETVAQLFESCVDMTEGVASLLMGDGHMQSSQATCMAQGLAQKDLVRPFAEAWAFGREVDPFDGNAALTNALLQVSSVCLPDDAFSWTDRNLPGNDKVQGTGIDSGNAFATSSTTSVPGSGSTGSSGSSGSSSSSSSSSGSSAGG